MCHYIQPLFAQNNQGLHDPRKHGLLQHFRRGLVLAGGSGECGGLSPLNH